MLDRDTAQKLSKELKIDLFTIYRENLQLLFLKYFYNQKGSEKICFKGGTALRFLFASFRFSEDLDFTSLVSEKRIEELVQKTLKNLNQEVENVIFKRAESIANSFSGRLFQDVNGFKFPLTVRLDFSLREKPINIETSYLETPFPIGPYPQISHFGIKEIMAEKIRAIITRIRGRDIFDLWFIFSKDIDIDWKLVNKKMAFYGKSADLKKLIQRIEKVPQQELKDDLTKFLPTSHRNLVEEIKSLALKKLRKYE